MCQQQTNKITTTTPQHLFNPSTSIRTPLAFTSLIRIAAHPAPSEVTSAPAPKGAKPRNRKGGYSPNLKAVASRERQKNMTPESRARALQNQTNYSKKRAKHAAENQSGFEELGDSGLSVDEDARVTQKR
jgi:hypothetical protein